MKKMTRTRRPSSHRLACVKELIALEMLRKWHLGVEIDVHGPFAVMLLSVIEVDYDRRALGCENYVRLAEVTVPHSSTMDFDEGCDELLSGPKYFYE